MAILVVAVAVSAAVMVPVGAQAEATVYGRINNAIVFEDTGAEGVKSTTDLRGIASRFGVKASSDLGNGLTAHGRYEFGTTSDKKASGITSTRIATAGISGGFGRIDVGNQWSAFYNTVGVDIDPTYFVGPVGGTPYRASNTIKYSNSIGPMSLELDLRMNDGKDNSKNAEGLRGNGAGLGIRVAATDNITLAFAYDSEDQSDEKVEEEPAMVGDNAVRDSDGNLNDGYAAGDGKGPEIDRMGVSVNVSMGRFWGALSYSSMETTDDVADVSFDENDTAVAFTDSAPAPGKVKTESEYTALYLGASITDSTSGWIGYSQSETKGNPAEPSKVALGLYHNMGGGLRLWYEGGVKDKDMAGMKDASIHYLGIRYDF